MARHSFIQMSKLPNVKGRISYITSHARQENLYATYRTADNEFWSNLARESQQEFKRSGTEGKCIEARELIIALPEVYTKYEPQEVLEDFTEEFHRRYGVECVSALHHNKRKTNYHIHLIFSERKLLPEPDIKIATRSVFYDETGKRVRTKKEITGEDGQIRKGCTVIKKGEVYESHLFTVKDDKFKSEPFLREVKEIYTDLINRHIADPEQQLKVFDKNSVYLPTKKIGKNNPKAAEIEADNAARQEWNRTADMALLPLKVVKHYGSGDMAQIATEILGLSKMNWNSFGLYSKLPCTIESSNEIARIGWLLSQFEGTLYDYRYFM